MDNTGLSKLTEDMQEYWQRTMKCFIHSMEASKEERTQAKRSKGKKSYHCNTCFNH